MSIIDFVGLEGGVGGHFRLDGSVFVEVDSVHAANKYPSIKIMLFYKFFQPIYIKEGLIKFNIQKNKQNQGCSSIFLTIE